MQKSKEDPHTEMLKKQIKKLKKHLKKEKKKSV
jgi:hypothetical protein